MHEERQDPVAEPGEPEPPRDGERTPGPDSPEVGGPRDEPRAPRSRGGRRGRATRPMDPARPCLNCGDPTPGEYCPTCGQRKVDVQVSVRVMLMDVLEDQFILDRRLPRTLGALLFRPGRLTVEHVNGRIASYIRPFRLYLVSSVIFFLLLSFFSTQLLEQADFGEDDRVRGAAEDSVALERLDSLLADTTLSPGLRPALTVGRDTVLQRLVRADSIVISRRQDRENWAEDVSINVGVARVDSAISRRIRTLGGMDPGDAVRTVVSEFFGYVPTMMFILLPIFALALKLLYVRRRRYYAEHFVFLLHAHSFVFLIFTTLLLLGEAGWLNGWLVFGLVAWVAVYLYLALRRVYGQGWLKTAVKWWVLGWVYFLVLATSIPIGFVATLLLL